MKKQIQAGFTLIELVVVIVILGILAAVAIPRFVDLSSDARGGVMRGVEAAMRSADTMIYAKSAANGTATDPSVASTAANAVKVNGVAIATVYGYAKDASELANALTLNPTGDFAIAAAGISHAKAGTAANCVVTYTPATSATVPPTYVTTVTGC